MTDSDAVPVTPAPDGAATGIAATEPTQPSLIPLSLTPADPAEYAGPGKIPLSLPATEAAAEASAYRAYDAGKAFGSPDEIKAWVRREIALRGQGHTEAERVALNP